MPTAVERIVWGFGDGSTIPVGKIGAAICWENRMPLLRTAMFGEGELFWQNCITEITIAVLK